MRPLCLVLASTLTVALPATAQETTGGVRGRLHSAAMGPVSSAHVIATQIQCVAPPTEFGREWLLVLEEGV